MPPTLLETPARPLSAASEHRAADKAAVERAAERAALSAAVERPGTADSFAERVTPSLGFGFAYGFELGQRLPDGLTERPIDRPLGDRQPYRILPLMNDRSQ